MRFNKDFVFIEEVNVNGAYGFETTEVIGTKFKAHSTPVKAETALKEQGIVTTKALRVITKDKINPDESLTLKNVKTDQKYKVIESLNYENTPYTIFLLEVV